MHALKSLRNPLADRVTAGAPLAASGASAQTAVPPVTDPGPPAPAPPTGESTPSAGAARRPGGGEGTRDAGLSGGGTPREGGSAPPSGPPKYETLRYDEDYSYLEDPAQRTDPWDALKYVALFGRDDWFLTLGGETGQRFEAVRNDALGGLPYTDGYYLQRYLLHADLHPDERVRVFARPGRSCGRSAGVTPATSASPRQSPSPGTRTGTCRSW